MTDDEKREAEERREAVARLSKPARLLIIKLASGEIFDERTIMHAWRWIGQYGIRDEVLPAYYALRYLVKGGGDAARREIDAVRALDKQVERDIDAVLSAIESAMNRMEIARGEVLRQLHAKSGGNVS